ncbi:hypothetical protein BE11_37465 [Sorangium cellulosum]|nr:hypothetical protein BE11_37465 [Sorangium cellulosum]
MSLDLFLGGLIHRSLGPMQKHLRDQAMHSRGDRTSFARARRRLDGSAEPDRVRLALDAALDPGATALVLDLLRRGRLRLEAGRCMFTDPVRGSIRVAPG